MNAKDDPKTFSPLARAFLWTEDKHKVNRLVYGLGALCAILFLADFSYEKHSYVSAEDFPGFYAFYGFFMSVALVICAKVVRLFLKRDEDYYAPYDTESEAYPEDQLERINHDD